MWLKKILEKGNDCSGRTKYAPHVLMKKAVTDKFHSIVLVPGNDGDTLADQTCSHFPSWLEDVVASRDQCTAIWVFRHDIRIETLGSWFTFVEAGPRLLQELIHMQEANRIVSFGVVRLYER